MKILTLLLLFLTASCSSQVSKKVLASGIIYEWQIIQMTDRNQTEVYFDFKFTDGSTKLTKSFGHVGFVGIEEKVHLMDFVYRLRWYANSTMAQGSSHYYFGHRFEIQIDETYLYIYDWNGKFIRLTKGNAKSLATDIEKSLTIYK